MGRDLSSHYEHLARGYNGHWAYSQEFLDWMRSAIVTGLRLRSGDRVADLGCGTGLYSAAIADVVGQPVVCVDASAAMLGQLPDDPRLVAVHRSAEDVAAGCELPYERFDAVVLKEVIHHVADVPAILAGLARRLAPGGRLLVVMLPKRIEYPLFAAALDRFTQLQPDPADVAAGMRQAGLDVETWSADFQLVFALERYLDMVRDRYMSLLSTFDDEQLAAGIAEIRARHRGPEVRFVDRFAFVRGTGRDST